MLKDGLWHDVQCSAERLVICEKRSQTRDLQLPSNRLVYDFERLLNSSFELVTKVNGSEFGEVFKALSNQTQLESVNKFIGLDFNEIVVKLVNLISDAISRLASRVPLLLIALLISLIVFLNFPLMLIFISYQLSSQLTYLRKLLINSPSAAEINLTNYSPAHGNEQV